MTLKNEVRIELRTGDDPGTRIFYYHVGYPHEPCPQDEILTAVSISCGREMGDIRLTEEGGLMVLRGMQVLPKYQKQGIGSKLLKSLVDRLRDRECYCLPYAHLKDFYGQAGFETIEPADAPPHLRERLAAKSDPSGYLIMKRGRVA